ncbi:MAG: hypothetical protein HY964_04675 [Ignavibacteriales bacterium]|nr:hypothetical protein [Ignavibacteriales bacterium]
MKTHLLFFLLLVLCLSNGFIFAQSTIEVGGYTGLTNNSNWDRNPSITFFNGEYWLFYTKADNDGVRGVSGYNPDNETYVVWYKHATSISGLTAATETKLNLSETARPTGFDQRLASAVAFNGSLYAFVSCGYSQAIHPVYYYKWDGSNWTGPTSLATGGAAHVNVTADGDRVYIAVNSNPDNADVYTWNGATLNGPYNAGTGNIVPKITLKGGILYVISIAEPAWTSVEVWSGTASATPTLSYLSTPYTATGGAMVWDPTIFNDNSNLYVVVAPQTGDAPQWLAQTYSSDNGSTWTTPKNVSYGGYGSTYWWDFWPNGYFDGTDKYLFFGTEGNGTTYGDAEIAYTKMDWNLSNDHYYFIQNGIDKANSGDVINIAEGTYEGFSVPSKTNLTIRGAGNTTLIHPTTLISTGVGHKYDANMSVSVFVNNSTNVTIQNMKIEDNGVTPCGAGTPNAIVFWNASTGTINNCTIHGTYTIGGCQTGQGLAVDAGSGQTTILDVVNTNIDGYQKNAIDAVDGNSLTGNPGNITVNVTGGTISGAGSTSAIAQNGILFWNRSGGHVGGSVNGTTISNLTYAGAGTTASGIISSGDAVTISNTNFTGVQRYLASMGTGVVTATDNNIFDGINPSSATLEQLATLEDKIDHQMDDNATGFIAFKSGSIIVTPNNLGIQQGYNLASAGNTVLIASGTYTPTSTILLNKSNITLQGAGTSSTIIKTSQPVGNLFSITGSGTIIENLQIEKTDKAGEQNIIFVNASNVTIRNNLIWGKYVMGDGDVSRAMVVAGGLSGLTIEGNTIHSLRQPAYLNTSTGNITNNFVYSTRGWVIENGNYNFTGNTWGIGATANYVDIAIFATVNPAYYTDIIAMSNANNQAVIEDQRPTVRVLTIVYVDSSAIAGGDGTPTKPYQTITPAVPRVVTGGIILVAKGTYNEDVVITKGLNLFSTHGRINTIVNGQTEGWGGGALRINSSNVTVGGAGKGFTFNSKTSTSGVMLAACYISGARDNLRIEENKFVAAPRNPGNNESHALLTDGGQTNQTFVNNIFDGMSAPRFLVYVNGFADVNVHSTNIDFIGNTFVSTVGGLSLSSKDGEISGNYFQGAAGLGLSQLANNTITGNYFQGIVNNLSFNTLSGVDVDAVIASNTLAKKVVVRNAGSYRIESFPWGDFIVVRANIQGAVDAAQTGDSVLVSNETYEEQVEIAKDIILHGESAAGTIIKSPVSLTKYFTTSVNNYPIVYIHDASSPEVSNFTVDGAGRGNGNYRFQGIGFRNAGGKVDRCTIKDVRETPINGNQHGVGIYVYNDNGINRTLGVTNNTIFGFQKNGTAFNGPNLIVNADNNTVTGASAVNFIAQNCLQIGFGATGSLINNNISSVSYTPSTDVSCGLLLYQSGGTIQTRNNIISNTQVGINYINVGGEIKHNNITASAAGVGTTSFWGIIADPGETQRASVQPFDLPTTSAPKLDRATSSVSALTTTVDSNTVTGDGVNGVGIEADALGTETLNFSANENSVSSWGTGFVLYKESGATLNSILRRNSIIGNKYGVLDQTGVLQDAKENWWGSSSGPADPKTLPSTPNYNNISGAGDSVSAFIDYNPWYIDAGKTTLSIYTLTINSSNGSVDRLPDQPTYNHGTSVLLTPVANTGYHFTSWSGDIPAGHESDNPLIIIMDGNKNITAGFAINTYTLTVNAVNGSVDLNPPSGPYNHGTMVTLTPVASTGYHFTSWSGDLPAGHESDNPLTVTMDQNRTITAGFAINMYTLNVSSTNGNVDVNPPSGPYSHGIPVSLTATPNSGYNFIGWSGDVPSGHESDNPLNLIMDANKNITANFGINQIQVIVQSNPPGLSFDVDGTTYSATQTFIWTHGSNHTLGTTSPQTSPGTRYSFSNWSDGGAQSHSIAPTSNVTYTVNFQTSYLLSLIANPNGNVSAIPSSPDGYYAGGTLVQVNATPNTGYQFSTWVGSGSGSYTGTNNPATINMNAPITQTASFSIKTYSLIINAVHGSVTKIPDQSSYDHGTNVSLTPVADAGFHFVNWSGDVPAGHELDVPLSVVMDQNRTITANIIINPTPPTHIITATAGAGGSISPSGILTFDEGENQTFIITPGPHYHIDTIFVDGVSAGAVSNYTFTNIVADHTIHAVFGIDLFNVTVNSVGNGSVTKVPDYSWYGYGSIVQLQAYAGLGWKFSHWGGDGSGTANPYSVIIDGNKNITAIFAEDSLSQITYRSFTPESLALDKDNKEKINKYVLKKPVRVYFECTIQNNTGKKKSEFHIHFDPILIGGNLNYPLTITPEPLSMTFARPNAILNLAWGDSISPGETIKITGWGNKGKGMKVSYAWNFYGGGKHFDENTNPVNQLYLPMPNRVNALYEAFRQGGYNLTSGLVVGLNKKNGVDSSRYYAWLQSKSYKNVLQSLAARKGSLLHSALPRGLDQYANGNTMKGAHKTISPEKHNNALLADMIALKVNITASQLGITPRGFGELIYDDGTSNPLNGMMLKEISDYGDLLMLGNYNGELKRRKYADVSLFLNLAKTLDSVNNAFEGKLDTISFSGTLAFKGIRKLIDIPFLRANPLAIPSILIPSDSYEPEIPAAYSLHQNYPNPFNPTTNIRFDIPFDGMVTMTVYNTLGQEAAKLLDRQIIDAGSEEIEFNAGSLASGVYFYRLIVEPVGDDNENKNQFVDVKKMILIR